MTRILACLTVLLALAGPVAAEGVKVTPLVEAVTTPDGKPIVYPDGVGKVTALVVELAPGASTGPHRHPMPVFGYIIDGEVTVESEGHPPRRFTTGQGFMETTVWHNGVNTGTAPVRILALYLGAEGMPLVVKPQGGDGTY